MKQVSKTEVLVRFSRGVEKKWKVTDDEAKRGLRSRKPLAHIWKTSDVIVDKKMKNLIRANTPRRAVQIKKLKARLELIFLSPSKI